MSYSFTVKAGTKDQAKAKVAEELDKVIENQPSHKADRDAALATASAFIDVLKDVPEGDEVVVTIHGSLSWSQATPDQFISASVGVSASLREIE